MKKKFVMAILAAVALYFGPTPKGQALTIDDRTWSGTSCGSSGGSGSGDCYGLTYHLVITDGGDGVATTFGATLDITGTYTGTMTYIGAVDFKPGDVVAPTALTAAPGGVGEWTTVWTDGQAATNCLNGSGGFLCSRDTGTNNAAPLTNGGAVDYDWAWDFSMSGAYAFGHLGVNFTVEDDSGRCSGPGQVTGPDCLTDGHNLSISGGGGPGSSATTATGVPEPSTFMLVGAGLLIMGRRIRSKKE